MKNPKSDPAARSRSRTRPKPRRLSSCYRHPDEPVNGICASCLRERLSGLDSSGDPPTSFFITLPELRRCRSVSAAKSEASCSYGGGGGSGQQPRRRSCDVRDRNTLSDLLEVDDGKNAVIGSGSIESKNLGFCKVGDEVTETTKAEDKIHEEDRVLDVILPRNVASGDAFDDNDEEGEIKTMKEFIDLEIQCKNEKPKELRNLWDAASVFSRKLRKWRQKQKNKELSEGNIGGVDANDGKIPEFRPGKVGEAQSEEVHYAFGRRSCDIDCRLQVDFGRISIDEPRASWDGGYLIDMNTPRHGRTLSVLENGMLSGGRFDSHRLSVDGQMQSIVEDGSSSGGSGPSNSDDSSSSRRPSSFDWSCSVRSFGKKTIGLESDEANSLVNVRMSPHKLVITERELKDWRLKSVKDDDNFEKFEHVSEVATSLEAVGSLSGSKKSTRWQKMCNVLGFRPKSSEKKCGSSMGNAVDLLIAEGHGNKGRESGRDVIEASACTLMLSGSVASSRKSLDMMGLNQSVRNGEEVKEASGWKLTCSGSIASSRKSFDMARINPNARNRDDEKEGSGWKLTPSGSVASSRRPFDRAGLNQGMRSVVKGNSSNKDGGEDFILELNKRSKRSVAKFDDDVIPFYLAPLRSSKSGRHRPKNSLSMSGDILPLY